MKLCAEIQRGRYPTKSDLARIANRTPRTVQNDMRALKDDWGAPLAFDREKNGFYFTDPAWRLPPIRLTEGELICFFAAERILRRLSATSEVQLARSALRRLTAFLPDEVMVDLGALEDAISFAPEPVLDASPEILRKLATAATHRQTIHMHYYSQHRNAPTERDVDVLLVHNHLGEWYAVCRDHSDEDRIKDFHAGRISKITEIHRPFTLPDNWPEERERYLKRGFGMFRGGKEVVVEVEFDSYQARYARERSFHPTQSREELNNGRLRVKFETSEAALEQVARWLMQYGEHAVAVRPAELREMVRERLRRATELYEQT
jgi:predicted DNA-binding transcriptional regulator YafY